jgi:ABC-type glycerol-3-phosphate transport system permease component
LFNSIIVTTGDVARFAAGRSAAIAWRASTPGGAIFILDFVAALLPPIAIVIPIFLLFRTLQWMTSITV